MTQWDPDAWARLRPAPPIGARTRLLIMAVGAGIGLLSWNVVNLIASAWEVCADLDAPDRAGLTILYFPGIIVAMGLAAAVAARLTKRHHPVLRIGLVMLAVGLVAVLVIALSVPYGGEFVLA